MVIFATFFILSFFFDFIVRNSESDSVNFKLIFSSNFYKTEIFHFTKKKNLVCLAYNFFILAIFFASYKVGFDKTKIFFDVLILTTFLLAAIIDVKYRIVPNFVVIILLAIGLFFIFHNPYLPPTTNLFKTAVFGLILSSTISILTYFLGLLIFKKEALGFGDVKLFICIGLIFSGIGFLNIFFLSFLISAIFGAFFLFFRKKTASTYIPFVPFICFSVIFYVYCKNYFSIF